MSQKNEVRLVALNEEAKENVEVVSKLLMDNKVKCSWIDKCDVLLIDHCEEDVIYVVDPTEGKEVEHLVKLGCSVIGPQCAITVLKYNILLKKNLKYPVHNLSMFGCLICFSNIEPTKRTELCNKVECMGGNVIGSLTHDVTHLVVKEVGSVKYFSAAHVGIPIMVVDWIEHLWRHGQSRFISAKEGKWEEFKCPIFLGCSVSVTGFNTAERNKIQKLVSKFGGIYSGAMKLDYTTHLVVHKPEGQKYRMAKKFGVKVVNIDWVYKSIEKGSCQDHLKHLVNQPAVITTSKPNSSTPEKADCNSKVLNIHDMSNISMVTVNESVIPSATDTSSFGVPILQSGAKEKDLMCISVSHSFDQMFDGLSIYICGFSPTEQEKLHHLLIASGATRCNELSMVVTHIIVGSSSLLSESVKDSIQMTVNNSDSLQKSMVQPELDYWMDTLVKRSHQAEIQEYSDKAFSIHQKRQSISDVKLNFVGECMNSNLGLMHDVVSQYMDTHLSEDTLVRDVDVNHSTLNNNADEEVANDLHPNDENQSQLCLFQGLNFIVVGFDEEDKRGCADQIKSCGGCILSSFSKKVADYAVVPITGWQVDRTVQCIVTDFWIKSCLLEGCLINIDDHPMSRPFVILQNISPLDGCVTCLSKFQEPERSSLIDLMRKLGAVYQDNVARKDMLPMRKTTHLVVLSPEGDKYTGCKKWGISTVSCMWVYECARQGRKVCESHYIINEKVNADAVERTFDIKNVPNIADDAHCMMKSSAVGSSDLINREIPYVEKGSGCTMALPQSCLVPSVVDHVDQRLDSKKAKKNIQVTPFKDKVLQLMDTPSKLMGPDINASFQLEEVFSLFKTPLYEQNRVRTCMNNHPETPLSDYVERFLKESLADLPHVDECLVKNLEKIFENASSLEDKKCVDERKDGSKDQKQTASISSASVNIDEPLKGVVLYVCKKLTKQRMELSDIVTQLGGEFRWTYDFTCTHFVFQGKLNDINREFRLARSDEKIIVSPHWLLMCKSAGVRLAEEDFPHVYNPNKSIQIVPTASQSRSKRTTKCPQEEQATIRTTRSMSNSLFGNHSLKTNSEKEQEPLAEVQQEERENLKKTLETLISSTNMQSKNLSSRNNSRNAETTSPQLELQSKNISLKTVLTSEKPGSSQDVYVTWDDPIGRDEMEKIMNEQRRKKHDQICNEMLNERITPAFLISSVSPEQKIDYASVIKGIGGIYLDCDYFDTRCTHLIVKKPARNEKYLASLASGKWILHTSYMEACKKAGVFVKEEHHEYGNPLTMWKPSNDTEALLAAASCRWRLFLNSKRASSGGIVGAFSDWKVLLHVSQRHCPGFIRLLESGNGQVVARSIAYDGDVSSLTHAIIDPNCIKEVPSRLLLQLNKASVHCCLPEYIADYLMKDPLPNVKDFYLPAFKSLIENDDDFIEPKKKK